MQTEETTPKEHIYKEAFCLMWYQSNGGHKVRIWNSRNGVTPFIIYLCGQEYQHVMWHLDEAKPDYVLRHGDLFFRDTTEEEAKNFAKRRLDKCNGTAYELKEGSERYVEVYDALVKDFYGDGDQPILDLYK